MANQYDKKTRKAQSINWKVYEQNRTGHYKNVDAETTKPANIMVGDFVSELYTAIRYRERLGLREGDWVEDPERAYTDGGVFGQEERSANDIRLQIALALDTSSSMWVFGIMKWAGPAFQAMHKMLRQSQQDFPEGCITYQPFVFHSRAGPVPDWTIPKFGFNLIDGGTDLKGFKKKYTSPPQYNTPHLRKVRGSSEMVPMNPEVVDEYKKMYAEREKTGIDYVGFLTANDTKAEPLFKSLQQWEEKHGDPQAVCVDLVLTDGSFSKANKDQREDIERANRTIAQRREGRRVITVFLNFLPPEQWEKDFVLPNNCYMFHVTQDNLTNRIRDILAEAIADLP